MDSNQWTSVRYLQYRNPPCVVEGWTDKGQNVIVFMEKPLCSFEARSLSLSPSLCLSLPLSRLQFLNATSSIFTEQRFFYASHLQKEKEIRRIQKAVCAALHGCHRKLVLPKVWQKRGAFLSTSGRRKEYRKRQDTASYLLLHVISASAHFCFLSICKVMVEMGGLSSPAPPPPPPSVSMCFIRKREREGRG